VTRRRLLAFIPKARVDQLRIASGMQARDDCDAFAVEPIEEAVREAAKEHASRLPVDDRMTLRERESGCDRSVNRSNELGTQTRVLSLVPKSGGVDVIERRCKNAGCCDAHLPARRFWASAQVMTSASPLSSSSSRRSRT